MATRSSIIGGLLLAALLVPGTARAKRPEILEPMDLMLKEFRQEIDGLLKPDTGEYQRMKKGSPRALIRFQGEIHRFPPIPDMEPSPDELGNTYPLTALPPDWIGRLNDLGHQLFQQGLEDGAANQVAGAWKGFRDELEGIDVPRVEIPNLTDLAEGYDSKFDYTKMSIGFDQLDAARNQVEQALGEVQGGRRSQVLNLADDDPGGAPLIQAFQQHEDTAREVGQSLRTKIEGILKSRLIKLQAEIYGELEAKLGRQPMAKDVGSFGQLMPKQWRKLIRWNHARHYWAGYRAVAGRIGGGTGDGQSAAFEGQGTGSGAGGSFAGGGTGDGTGETESGGGTGDGTAAIDPSKGSGTGDGS